jgi:hypothetical protein
MWRALDLTPVKSLAHTSKNPYPPTFTAISDTKNSGILDSWGRKCGTTEEWLITALRRLDPVQMKCVLQRMGPRQEVKERSDVVVDQAGFTPAAPRTGVRLRRPPDRLM